MTAETLDMLAAVAAAEAALDQWDAPPSLAMIVDDPDGGPRLEPFELSAAFWTQGPVFAILHGIAGTTRDVMPMEVLKLMVPSSRNLIGVALFTEAWGMKTPADATVEEREAADEWTASHKIADHPDRIEMKVLTAIDRDGIRYVVEHSRGDTEPITAELGGPEQYSGRVLDGLEQILLAFQDRLGSAFQRPSQRRL